MGHLALPRLPQQTPRSADAHRIELVDLWQQLPEGVAGVEDVVDHEDLAAADIGREQIEVDHQRSGPRAAVALIAGLDQLDAHGVIQPPDQIGQKHETAGQHADHGQGALLVVLADFAGEAIDPLAELFLREQGFHADSPEVARGG